MNSGYDYIALGHIHKATKVEKAGETYFAYPGCLEGRSFDECGSKGAIIIEYTKRMNSYRENVYEGKFDYKKFAKRKYESFDVDVTGMNKRDDIIDAINKTAQNYHVNENTLCRVTLKGMTDVNLDLSSLNVSNADLGVAYVEIKDKTIPLLGSESFESDITIRGVFYRELKPSLESEDEKVRERARDALRFGLEALSGYKANDIGQN